jgi:hypothetical protein
MGWFRNRLDPHSESSRPRAGSTFSSCDEAPPVGKKTNATGGFYQQIALIDPNLADRCAATIARRSYLGELTKKSYQIAQDFRLPARRAKGRIAGLCNPLRNTAGGRKDKQAGNSFERSAGPQPHPAAGVDHRGHDQHTRTQRRHGCGTQCRASPGVCGYLYVRQRTPYLRRYDDDGLIMLAKKLLGPTSMYDDRSRWADIDK